MIHWARLSLTAYTPETNATAMSRRKKNQEARLLQVRKKHQQQYLAHKNIEELSLSDH